MRPIAKLWSTLMVVLAIAVIIAFIALAQRQQTRAPATQAVSSAPLASQPEYSTPVTSQEGVIEIGTQPNWPAAGAITEVIKRDLILNDRLKSMGLELRFYDFLAGRHIRTVHSVGQLDGGLVNDLTVLTIGADGGIVVTALIDNSFDDIVASHQMLISDLKGKRIACQFDALSHHALLDALKAENITEDQVAIYDLSAADMPGALKSRQVDACVTWEPVTSTVLEANPGSAVIFRTPALGFLYFRKEFADKHHDAVVEIAAAEIRAVRWLMLSRENLVQACQWTVEQGSQLRGPAERFTAERFANILTTGSVINEFPVIPQQVLGENGGLRRDFQFLKDYGRLPPEANWEKAKSIFDTRIVRDILADPNKYKLEEFRYSTGGGSGG